MNEKGMTNGFTIKSWSDLASFILLITFIISGLVWGMKLESRYDKLENEVANIRSQVGRGVLPRAEERINDHDRRLKYLESAEHKHKE